MPPVWKSIPGTRASADLHAAQVRCAVRVSTGPAFGDKALLVHLKIKNFLIFSLNRILPHIHEALNLYLILKRQNFSLFFGLEFFRLSPGLPRT